MSHDILAAVSGPQICTAVQSTQMRKCTFKVKIHVSFIPCSTVRFHCFWFCHMCI